MSPWKESIAAVFEITPLNKLEMKTPCTIYTALITRLSSFSLRTEKQQYHEKQYSANGWQSNKTSYLNVITDLPNHANVARPQLQLHNNLVTYSHTHKSNLRWWIEVNETTLPKLRWPVVIWWFTKTYSYIEVNYTAYVGHPRNWCSQNFNEQTCGFL